MAITNPVVNKVFNDLEAFLDYCRSEGKVFNEAALYKKTDPIWQAYEKYRGWIRAKARAANRDQYTRDQSGREQPNRRY
jgi:hypothetical protein